MSMKKKILITGATGFIGSHLTELCVELGYDVKIVVRYNQSNHLGCLEGSEHQGRFEAVSGDVRNYSSIFDAMKGCCAVFHLAALSGIPYSLVSPLSYIHTNIEGTYNTLEAARNLEIENILIASSSVVYGDAQYLPMDEKHPVVGQSPYSASKIAAEQLAISYYCSFNTPVKIVRLFSTYGPRQSTKTVIPTIITQILDGQGEIKLGNLQPTRDLTYVKDVCNGLIEIYESDKIFGEIVNLGINEEISIGHLTNKIVGILDKKVDIKKVEERTRSAKEDVERMRCDNTKILKNTNWSPQYDLEKGLNKTIEWLKENTMFYKSNFCK